ncbi:MAG: hypothetical protein J2P59_12740, partial [Acidimicrobiales bacterium]|nr:hypothetical protein [Acidimicrobiales bacterium]
VGEQQGAGGGQSPRLVPGDDEPLPAEGKIDRHAPLERPARDKGRAFEAGPRVVRETASAARVAHPQGEHGVDLIADSGNVWPGPPPEKEGVRAGQNGDPRVAERLVKVGRTGERNREETATPRREKDAVGRGRGRWAPVGPGRTREPPGEGGMAEPHPVRTA